MLSIQLIKVSLTIMTIKNNNISCLYITTLILSQTHKQQSCNDVDLELFRGQRGRRISDCPCRVRRVVEHDAVSGTHHLFWSEWAQCGPHLTQ